VALNPRGPLGTGPIGPVSNQSLDGWMDGCAVLGFKISVKGILHQGR